MTVYTTRHNDRAHAVRVCLDNLFSSSGHVAELGTDGDSHTVRLNRKNDKPLSRATKRICNVLTEGMYIADTTGDGRHTVAT